MITLHPPFLSALVTGGGAAAIGCWSLIRPSFPPCCTCCLQDGGGAWKRERRKVLSIRLEGASLSFSHSLSPHETDGWTTQVLPAPLFAFD